MTSSPSWWRRRVVDPILVLLKRGATPTQVTKSIAIGAVIGVFPVLGTTTVICLLVAWRFRLNIAAMQVPNILVYPIQLALIVPFIRLGERWFGAPALTLSRAGLIELFGAGTLHAVAALWRSLMFASLAWLVVTPLVAVVLYAALLPVVRRLAAAYSSARTRSAVL